MGNYLYRTCNEGDNVRKEILYCIKMTKISFFIENDNSYHTAGSLFTH